MKTAMLRVSRIRTLRIKRTRKKEEERRRREARLHQVAAAAVVGGEVGFLLTFIHGVRVSVY